MENGFFGRMVLIRFTSSHIGVQHCIRELSISTVASFITHYTPHNCVPSLHHGCCVHLAEGTQEIHNPLLVK
jgi:hypothetical protein